MKHILNIHKKRVLAIALVFVMLLGMLPTNVIQVRAATEAYPEAFTMKVTDGTQPIADAEIRIYTNALGEDSFDLTASTDDNGVVAFEELTEIAEKLEEEIPIYYIVTAYGYETSVNAGSLSAETASKHIDVRLTAKQKATVYVGLASGQATVEIDGEVRGSKTVFTGDTASIVVTPAQGYYISAVQVGQTVVDPPEKNKAFRCNITVSQDIMVLVTLVREYTVSKEVSVGGSVSLNGENSNSVKVDEGDSCTLNVVADDNYRIDSIQIGEEVLEDVRNLTVFSKKITVNSDLIVRVTFVRVWTVTVSHTGNGQTASDPAGEGGVVQLLAGEKVKVTATPNEGWRVSAVKINGASDSMVSGFNDSMYNRTLTADRDYTVEVTFSPNVYNITVGATNNGSVSTQYATVEHGGRAMITITPANGYTLDYITVNGVTVSDLVQTETGAYFYLENISEHKDIQAKFKLIAIAESSYMEIDVSAALRSDEAKRLFVLKEGDSLIFKTTAKKIRIYDSSNRKIGEGDASNPISIGETVTVKKIELFYRDTYEWFSHWHSVTMDPIHIVVDKGDNVKASLTPAFQPNAYGYYKGDIPFSVSAEDTGDYSGIALIQAWITCDGVKSSVQELYRYDGGEIAQSLSLPQCYTVSAAANNSENVIVYLRVVDRAGNEVTLQKTLKISIDAPLIDLSIDGSRSTNALEGYYNDQRTLTLTVQDRSDVFSPAAIAEGMKIIKNGSPLSVASSDIAWSHNGNTHIGTYVFKEDGYYEWSLSYTNKAGNEARSITCSEGNDLYSFIIDKEKPYGLTIDYAPGFIDTILEGISFGFYQTPVKVTLTARDATAGIETIIYSYSLEEGADAIHSGMENVVISSQELTRDGDLVQASFTIPAQFRGKVSFTAIDKAGHGAELTDDAHVLVIDTIAPGITVEYDMAEALNGSYYRNSRNAVIRIQEANFFPEDVEDGLLLISVHKKYADGSVREELLTPSFTKDGSSYVAEIVFDEDADYEFDVSYTDRAGNTFDSYPADRFTIDLSDPKISVSFDNNECINENHFMDVRTATITIEEHNFRASDVVCTITENGVPSEYYLQYLRNEENWTHEGNLHTAKILFSGGIYTFNMEYTDLAGRKNTAIDFGDSIAPQSFVVDTGAPEALKISYSPSFAASVLEALSFGFYDAPVKVTIEAMDYTAGIDHFLYSYLVQDGASSVNSGEADVLVSSDEITYDEAKASYTFTIPAQFRGYVSFTAVDRSGHSSFYADSNVVVVDTIAPGITVSYDNLNAYNRKYFNQDRTATITIEEANFFPQDLEDERLRIMVGITDLLGNTTESLRKPVFTKDGDIYTAQILFNENADYTFDISYTDRAGNVYDDYEQDVFTIDKIAPILTVSYDKAAAVDEYYFKEDIVLSFAVEEHNFRASDISLELTATDVTGTVPVDLSEKNYLQYLRDQNNWTRNGDTWSTEIVIDLEGNYELSASYTDLANQSNGDSVTASFCLDKTAPEELKISYEPGFLSTILEALSFGFYQAPVTVTIEAKDSYSGMEEFVYSYFVQEGSSEINTGRTDVIVHSEDMTFDGAKASYSFQIPAQFRGKVSFRAIDHAHRESVLQDENYIVVDTIAPFITVTYDHVNPANGSYFNTPRTASISIEEANFFAQDISDGLLVLTVGKTLNDGTYSETVLKPEFSKNGDVYTTEVLFDEDADYSFHISYTDRAGNTYDSYETDLFTVDLTRPRISVEYDNNSARNENQFKANRTATITIVEHNFSAELVNVQVKENGSLVEAMTELLKKDESWTHNGDVHTAVVPFTDEAHYEFDISCTDLSGLWNDGVNYGNSIAPTKFTLDKSAPTDLSITIAEKAVLGSNSIAFDTFYAETVTLRLSAKFDISGMESMEYQKVNSVSQYSENGNWQTYNQDSGIVVAPSEKFVLYFRAQDRAGNYSIVNSTGIIVDNQMPTGEVNAPSIDIIPSPSNSNGIHKGDVNVSIKVIDPKYQGSSPSENGFYSGLKRISYRIYATDTNEAETGVLLDLAAGLTTNGKFDADSLISSWSGSIKVAASRFNSNQVQVEITAEDNAGNIRTSTTPAGQIKIDTTAPRIDVAYSNNEADNGTYFKRDRTATISITERNFDPAQVLITLSNRSGATPRLSNWTKSEAGGNGDGTRWTATLQYTADGEYQFDISYTDQAGNAAPEANYGASVAPKAFTIDKTLPVINVSYDNNEVFNKSYYQAERTATIVISEKNLDPNGADKGRIQITLTAVQDGKSVTLPKVSAWSSSGAQHTATVQFSDDAVYSFDISVTDKAGNSSVDFAQHSFCVDKTAPELSISGVEDGAAYAGEVRPVISYSDVNFNQDQVEITLLSSKNGTEKLPLNGSLEEVKNGGVFTFANFAEDASMDDIYTLSAKITDEAGNITERSCVFSVNRFGSSYGFGEDTQKLNGSYVQEGQDIVITETNVDALTDIQITLFKNNETIILEEGKDFGIEEVGGNGSWHQYSYTIFSKNFEDDGVYRLSIRSVDGAGNVAENSIELKDAAFSFGVDKTKPVIVVQNLESKHTYALDNLEVLFSASDNLLLDSVEVYVDDFTKAAAQWDAKAIAQMLSDGSDFSFNISGDSTEAHQVRIVCKDAAGNEEMTEITDFYVTTNLWVRYWNNKPLFFGSLAGVVLLLTALGLLLGKKKKSKEA